MKYTTLNNIAQVGLNYFTESFEETDDINDADVVLVRSTDMKSMEMPEKLLAIVNEEANREFDEGEEAAE